MTDLATAYRGVRVRVPAMVVDHSAEADTVIPAAPDWTVWNAAGIGARAVEHEAGPTFCGDGPTAAAVRVTRFEFTRAAAGRRSPDQVAAYEWDGLARPDLLVVNPFTPRLAALVE